MNKKTAAMKEETRKVKETCGRVRPVRYAMLEFKFDDRECKAGRLAHSMEKESETWDTTLCEMFCLA